MLKIGVVQLRNSISVESNYYSIRSFLKQFEENKVDLILFPECALSGFSSKITECSLEKIKPFLHSIDKWSKEFQTHVVLPTAIADREKIYNSGFWFSDKEIKRFQKCGLTDSERNFFSVSKDFLTKVFEVKGYRCALLICMEAQQLPYTYFPKNSADLILWPGYWGWTPADTWSIKSFNNKENLVYKNMISWQLPLIQSNFAFNDLDDKRASGPEGLSIVVNKDNNLCFRGKHMKESAFIVTVKQNKVICCNPLSDEI